MKNIFLTAVLSCSLLQADDQSELAPLSLEDLLNIQVTSTSRRDESQHLAPGVITVVSAQEIHQYGARHLRDVIDRLVGMQVLSSHQRPHNKTSIRGMNGAHQEGWEVVLLNGRPIHDGTDGGFNFDIYLGFPLEMIDHIEVIRGPGSVIYGTNAMAGVINIVTKDAQKSINETRIDIGAGSFNRTQLQLSTLIGGADYSLNIGLNAIRANGDSINGVLDKDHIAGTYDSGENSDNLVINGKYKGFTLNAMVMNNDADSGGSSFQLPSSPMEKKRGYLDVGYLYDITSGWDASFNYTVNLGEFDWQISETGGRNHYKDRYDMAEMIVRGNIATDLNLLFGANSSNYETEFKSGFPYSEMNSKSAYTQIDYMLSPKQKIIAGIQLNKPEDTQTDLSKRAGFIQGFGNNWWLKLLYSEAYRSPNLQEAKINAPTLRGNPLLNPEKVATYDAQLIYQTPKQYYAIALYDTVLDNLIVRVSGTPTTFANQGNVHFQGIEMEGRVEVNEDFNILGNFSYQINKTNSGVKDTTFAPNMMAKLGGSYSGFHGMNIAVFNSYIGSSNDQSIANSALNPEPDAYNLLTANVSVDTAQTWGIGKRGHSLLSLYLDNLLDEDVYSPNLNYTNGTNTIPHHWGRSANLTYTYKF
ncbi:MULTISPECIES: TonB-dependent receptor plug domain-containing protein [unclassified Sulfuricurvum]|uniref:TonB-dependent receptor plug domain-containing protein n=1 Tax=unclassified Sulfuricurvum TaxID=2632390 RepID=UPI0002996FFF|nr:MULTISPECIES: TonB-dependent receptor [unclassified Sulfuricurvum]AFV96320.1 TonB-dependent receptor [Candidatus Sulfuricurvum sp. RIFRC-1]HBM36916.1 TonB-dependent receptor [Sulfuricurvum sp.]